jgi:hypothetical protein
MGEDVVIVQEALCHGAFENVLVEFECWEEYYWRALESKDWAASVEI